MESAWTQVRPEVQLEAQFIGDWPAAIQKLLVSITAGDPPDDRYNFLGFRVARELTPP